jgi:hypothetical protein
LVVRGAFVVQLRKAVKDGRLEGLVEEVDTGSQIRFHTERELIGFLRKRFAQTRQSSQQKDQPNEPKHDRK